MTNIYISMMFLICPKKSKLSKLPTHFFEPNTTTKLSPPRAQWRCARWTLSRPRRCPPCPGAPSRRPPPPGGRSPPRSWPLPGEVVGRRSSLEEFLENCGICLEHVWTILTFKLRNSWNNAYIETKTIRQKQNMQNATTI